LVKKIPSIIIILMSIRRQRNTKKFIQYECDQVAELVEKENIFMFANIIKNININEKVK
jgi:uncharacterized membrane protein YkgB